MYWYLHMNICCLIHNVCWNKTSISLFQNQLTRNMKICAKANWKYWLCLTNAMLKFLRRHLNTNHKSCMTQSDKMSQSWSNAVGLQMFTSSQETIHFLNDFTGLLPALHIFLWFKECIFIFIMYFIPGFTHTFWTSFILAYYRNLSYSFRSLSIGQYMHT